MKRKSRLNRKTPLKPSSKGLKRSRLARQSKERRELRKQVAPLEKEFLSQFPMCVYCGVRRSTGIDHIAGGASRKAALTERCAWNSSCWECNSGDANDPMKFPIERKLAVKLTTDGEFFDLDTFNKLRGRAAGAITLAEVSAFLEWR